MQPDQIIQAIKEKWIAEFGSLQHEVPQMGGYFIAGFVADVLNDAKLHIPIIIDFKAERLRCKLTLREVESKTGISNAYLSQLESGKIKKPSYDTVKKLTDLYNQYTP